MKPIVMVDLKGQYEKIKDEIDAAVLGTVSSTQFINGPQVADLQKNLEAYLGIEHVIPCANGTDALQIAMMALGLEPGDEVIVPAFTFIATAEVIALLRLTPVMVDVDEGTFNVTAEAVEAGITPRTKAIVPVHMFGQSCDMEPIMAVAAKHGIPVIEDNAQAIGADYIFADGRRAKTGTVGDIGCTSFFPSKNLGCYGDGGAIFTNDGDLAEKMRIVANHGQTRRYYHDRVGVNSRLDSIQAAVLNVKLPHLDEYCDARRAVAERYDAAFADIDGVKTPAREPRSTHVFHQYTLRIADGRRDELNAFLAARDIPSMIYYPVPLYKQEAFKETADPNFTLPATERLCEQVLSLPIHTEMDRDTQDQIIAGVQEFFVGKTRSAR
ncbi:MAG: DegT/DnrJ/EryC1/StrS family aminotransferase [Acidobacteria bacterium]|nr:DegT/DnrJ/EryC1/StrS family aminotransferase [Acidobacteriota bacterium]